MKNMFSFIMLTILSLFSGLLSAHSGHGDHSLLYANAQPHPVIGMEHLLALSLAVAIVYLVMRQLRK